MLTPLDLSTMKDVAHAILILLDIALFGLGLIAGQQR